MNTLINKIRLPAMCG